MKCEKAGASWWFTVLPSVHLLSSSETSERILINFIICRVNQRASDEGGSSTSTVTLKQDQTGREGSRRLRFPGFWDSRHTKVARLSELRTGRLYPSRGDPWYSCLLDAESTPGPVTPSGIEPATFWLVAQCLSQLQHRSHLCWRWSGFNYVHKHVHRLFIRQHNYNSLCLVCQTY